MEFNHILLDIIDWIRRVLWWNKRKINNKPYKILKTYQGKGGILKLVERDTPRAVSTFVFTPYKTNLLKPGDLDLNVQKDIKDIHICLDHLWALDYNDATGAKKILSKTGKRLELDSHAVTILEASRWVNKQGKYTTNVIYQGDYDFIGTDTTAARDKYAKPSILDLALIVKDFIPIYQFNWEWEIKMSQRKFMGIHYIKKKI